MRRLRRAVRRLPPFLHWSAWLWTLVGAETLLLLFAWSSYHPPEGLLLIHRRQQAAYFGPDGVMQILLVVNLIAVVSLWVTHRGARRFSRELYLPLAATTLVGSLALAAISWSVFLFQKRYPAIRTHLVLELVHDPGPGEPATYSSR